MRLLDDWRPTGMPCGGAMMKNKHLATIDAYSINEPAAILYEQAITRNEGSVVASGALIVNTGEHTGRSPADKFIVRDSATEPNVWWQNNRALSSVQFALLKEDFMAHAESCALYQQDLFAGSEANYRLSVRVICENAWHALFIQHLLIRPTAVQLASFSPQLTILNFPSFRANPEKHGTRSSTVIACDLSAGLILIGGTSYAGEMKKSVFTTLNYLLPEKGVMPMHCAANTSADNTTALFFGLSGTGKTTLSANSNRMLVGDDEHGWSENGIFNFEGGCYAKVINLSSEAEPEIFTAANRWATILENVGFQPSTREPDFHDATLTENTRAAYSIEAIPNAFGPRLASHPKHIFMLTADAFGILPPIAQLTPEQAIYYFLSGYTAKVAGTEKGVKEPQATFSTCFGAPFMPRRPGVYGQLLSEQIVRHKTNCWLVNTGWTGGPFGVGHRMPITTTRRLVDAALGGELETTPTQVDRWFGFKVPKTVAGIEARILSPRDTWLDNSAYDSQASKLVEMFTRNFASLEPNVDLAIRRFASQLAKIA